MLHSITEVDRPKQKRAASLFYRSAARTAPKALTATLEENPKRVAALVDAGRAPVALDEGLSVVVAGATALGQSGPPRLLINVICSLTFWSVQNPGLTHCSGQVSEYTMGQRHDFFSSVRGPWSAGISIFLQYGGTIANLAASRQSSQSWV